MSAWVYFHSVPNPLPSNGWMWFCISENPINQNFEGIDFGVHPYYSNNLVFGIYDKSIWNWLWADSGVQPIAGKWYHFVGTWGSGGIKIYIDGELKGTNPYTGGVPQWTHYNYLGTNTWGGYVNSTIDEVRIYNRALSDSEIQELYFTTQPRFPLDNSVSYTFHWRMCDPNYPGDGEHEGVDIMVPEGTDVYPICDGIVVFNWTNSNKYKNEYDEYFNAFLVIKHDCNGQSLYGYYGHIISDLKANAGVASEVKVANHIPIGQIRKAYKIDKKTKAIIRDTANDHLHLGINITQMKYVTNHWGIAPPGLTCQSIKNNGWRDAIDYFGWPMPAL